MRDDEANRFSARASRYAKLGVNAGALAAKFGASRMMGGGRTDDARAFGEALGAMKGPMMKVAQMLATIPEALPADYAAELMKLQTQAPAMGASFVRRRMQAELGIDWREKFAEFDFAPAAAASLGQVHRGVTLAGEAVACKLQYPEMASAVEADIAQLNLLFSIHKRLGSVIDGREIKQEMADRLREELDYIREAKVAELYRIMLADIPAIRVPRVHRDLSTRRLLTLEWAEGEKLVDFVAAPAEARSQLASLLFEAWWRPFLRYGVIHGDPHLGNYSVIASGKDEERKVEGINLYDYGCVRIFPPRFVGGVVELYRALLTNDSERVAHAYKLWGFTELSSATIDAMNIWAMFICGPVLEDRVRSVADGVKPGDYGRREIGAVMRALREEGGDLTIPREFPLMDRAAIGLGAAFLRLGAELNFHRMFESLIEDFSIETIAERQREALAAVGL